MKETTFSKSFTTVTPFSKFVALIMLILFPILGFFLGVSYEKYISASDLRTYYKEVQQKVRSQETTMCTLEAKLCSDGSSVGRNGPNCEFAKCPGEEKN